MISILSRFHQFIIFLLFFHGTLYFITGDIYNKDNPLKLVKYFTTIIYLSSLLFFIFIKKERYFVLKFSFLYLVFSSLLVFFAVINRLPIEFVFFILFPCVYFFIHLSVQEEELVRLIYLVFITSFVFMVLEIFYFTEISARFDQSGFRSISIFVNPNAFGATIVLLYIALCFKIQSKLLIVFYSILVLLMVLLSGSKTAIGAYFLLVSLGFFKLILKRTQFVAISLIVFSFIFSVYLLSDSSLTAPKSVEVREFNLQSGSERVKEFIQFAEAADSCILVPYHCNNNIYLDNTFIYAWISLGVPGLIFVILCFVISLIFSSILMIKRRNYFFVTFFSAYWLMCMSTNLMNIWPTAYIFWIVFGYMYRHLMVSKKYA